MWIESSDKSIIDHLKKNLILYKLYNFYNSAYYNFYKLVIAKLNFDAVV